MNKPLPQLMAALLAALGICLSSTAAQAQAPLVLKKQASTEHQVPILGPVETDPLAPAQTAPEQGSPRQHNILPPNGQGLKPKSSLGAQPNSPFAKPRGSAFGQQTKAGSAFAANKKAAPSGFDFIDRWLELKPVKSWQKARLAEQGMKPGGANPYTNKFSRKVYASKENSRGGYGVGGGGCGCN